MRVWRALPVAVLIFAVAISLSATPGAAKAPGANGRIAFAKFDPGSTQGDTQLYTANPNGSDQRLQLPTHSCCPYWSPDGSEIAVDHLAADGRLTTAIIRPDGSGLDVKPIPDPTLNLGCGPWSPDGTRVACIGWDDVHKDRPRGLFTVRTSDWGDVRQLTTNPNGAKGLNDDPGDYSPDGSRIVFLREGSNGPGIGQNALFVISTDGQGLKRITPFRGADCCGGSWSPDGKWILYTNELRIEAVHPDGTGLHLIIPQTRCPHRSGPALLAGIRVYGIRCRKGLAHEIPSPGWRYMDTYDPTWSPDGRKFVVWLCIPTSAAYCKRGLFTANANGSNVRPVTRPVSVRGATLDLPCCIDWGPLVR